YAMENFLFSNFEIVYASFASIYDYCLQHSMLCKIDGIIMELGVSSPQLDNAARGVSFTHNGPLDLRMDVSKGITAS
ncbi:16S rRNA (cytosine(1402)-N(4))-methyltransferase, partial [Francisella tularensis]|uniref:16S rRNA (cytosine(1402)-N(4))-methyltransferase n=1 Tax=Francisella tularensis TaxID=263 RepID=UPI002381AFE0